MFPGILHRTVFGELAKVFVLSLLGITGIIVLAAIVVEASQRGLGPAQILAAIPLLVPSMLPFIIPPTTLFATCIVYGRLSHDNEIIAIKAAGINVLHVVWPGVFLGFTMSATTLGLYVHLIPYTQHLLRAAVVNDVEDFLYTLLKRDREIRRRPEMKLNLDGERGYEMFVAQVQGRVLKDAIFMRHDAKGGYDVVARAHEAELRVDMDRKEVIVHMRRCFVFGEAGRGRGSLDDREWSVPLPDIGKRSPSNRELSWRELLRAREKMAAEIEKVRVAVSLAVGQQGLTRPPQALLQQLIDLKSIERQLNARLNGLTVELHARPALSFGCLFFALVGCPVGIWFSRGDYLSAFITCFLPIVFLYYPLQLCGTNLAKDGKLPPVVALWMANAVMGVIALGLFRKLVKN